MQSTRNTRTAATLGKRETSALRSLARGRARAGLSRPMPSLQRLRRARCPRILRERVLLFVIDRAGMHTRARRSSLLATLSLAFALGCPKPTAVVDAGTGGSKPDAGAQFRVDQRPPHPNMATAAYGQRVLEERIQSAVASTGTNKEALDVLHDVQPGSEQRAAELAAAGYRAAKTDAERAAAITLIAVALVLDPVVEGYKERLTDAYGLCAYAVTVDQ